MRARLHACVAPRNRQSLLRRRISVQIASALPQKIPLLVDFVFTLSTSTACDSGSGQYEAPAMRRMVTCSLSARPATRALRAWSPPCANTPLPPHVGACHGHVTTTPLPQGTWTDCAVPCADDVQCRGQMKCRCACKKRSDVRRAETTATRSY